MNVINRHVPPEQQILGSRRAAHRDSPCHKSDTGARVVSSSDRSATGERCDHLAAHAWDVKFLVKVIQLQTRLLAVGDEMTRTLMEPRAASGKTAHCRSP